jgi:vitamin B12 transporter
LAGGFVAASHALAAPVLAPPPTVAQALDPFVITGTRTPVRAGEAGSVVDRLSSDELSRRQISGFSGALGLLGLPVFSSGQPGASTAIFLRGANSNQTLFLVDGLRFNDPNTDYAVFLGGACVSACDSLEVAHGPQSTLYGGEAVGGVVSLRSERGEGPIRQRAALEVGSFGTRQSAWSAQGAPGPWAFNVALQAGRTENDRPNNAFRSGNLTARLDRAVSSRVAVGATVRGFEGRYESPGTRFTNDPDNGERETNWLATAFTRLRWGDAGSSHLVFGGQVRRFESENPSPGRATQLTVVKNRRAVLDWQNTYAGVSGHRVTFGTTAESHAEHGLWRDRPFAVPAGLFSSGRVPAARATASHRRCAAG